MDAASAKTPPNLLIAGVDEAGRGPLAGPVIISAAVILNPEIIIVKDSRIPKNYH